MPVRYVFWKEPDYYIGYLRDYPDYQTEGATLDELQENLKDLYADIKSGDIPFIRQEAELIIA